VLVAAAVVAVVWANVGGYSSTWTHSTDFGLLSATPRAIVDDGLMTLFFFLVGLEIKRELIVGELRDRRAVALPALAAVGGIAVPALVFGVITTHGPAVHSWTIPLATDVAFSLGVLALLGDRVAPGARLFLLELAVVDDIGTLLIVAILFAGGGVSATLIGVVLALLVPVHPVRGVPVLARLEHHLLPWVSLGIVPLFALANAGVVLDGHRLGAALSSRITIALVVALVVGKAVGVVAMTAVAVKVGIGRLPAGVDLRDIAGIALVAGMSFTVSLYAAHLAFSGAALDHAKIGFFAASLLSALTGSWWLWRIARGRRETPDLVTHR
jgi:Na+:H+ antiporter, NhaA family